MLLAVDVGNTDITFGVFNGVELAARFRFTVKYQGLQMNMVNFFVIFLCRRDITLLILQR